MWRAKTNALHIEGLAVEIGRFLWIVHRHGDMSQLGHFLILQLISADILGYQVQFTGNAILPRQAMRCTPFLIRNSAPGEGVPIDWMIVIRGGTFSQSGL